MELSRIGSIPSPRGARGVFFPFSLSTHLTPEGPYSSPGNSFLLRHFSVPRPRAARINAYSVPVYSGLTSRPVGGEWVALVYLSVAVGP